MENTHLFDDREEMGEESLERLAFFCNSHKLLGVEIEVLDLRLKDLKEKQEIISRVKIPGLLNTVGLSELKLKSGEKVVIQDKVKANIAKKNISEAFAAMVEAEGGKKEIVNSLFKTQLVIPEIEDNLLDYLLEQGYTYDVQKTIHPQTLNKYCRERLSQGKNIPESITVFQYQETTIKK